MRILITSVGTSTSIGLIKGFRKFGDYIVGADTNEYGYTAGSVLVDMYYRVSNASNELYMEEIITIINEEDVDLFIPINDIEVYVIAKNIDKINCKCCIPSIETIEVVRDKYICNTVVEKMGVKVPCEISKDNINEKRILRDRIGVGSRGIVIIESGFSTPKYDREEVFLQKYVEGTEYTVDILCDRQGNPIYIIPRKRIEVKSGVATKVEIENNEFLISEVKRILSEIKLPGFSNMQFIRDEADNYWFVEINYRFSGAGATTLAVVNNYLLEFLNSFDETYAKASLNAGVKWNTVITRYYEEVVYEKGIS